jgi:hypothetical protein
MKATMAKYWSMLVCHYMQNEFKLPVEVVEALFDRVAKPKPIALAVKIGLQGAFQPCAYNYYTIKG